MSTLSIRRGRSAVLAVVTTLAACENPIEIQTPVGAHEHTVAAAKKTGTAKLPDLAAAVRKTTARYHATAQATRAGYGIASECVAVPGVGGMGYHWANFDLVDPVFDAMHPEVMVYSPGPDGRPLLGAVEYIVIDVGQPAPTFDGQAFDVGGTPVPAPHWSLHVWVHKDNPAGLFTPFNPDVSCS